VQELAAFMELGAVVDGRYRVDELLGGGAMGQVFRATDLELDRACCLKFVHGSHADFDLRTEARALAGIRHENVVTVYGFGHHAGQPYLAMEYVRGHDLGWLIFEHYRTHRAPIPVTRAIQIVRSLCDGLSAVHGAGMVHRDIKPQNVILEKRTGRPGLVDFGAAVGASRTTSARARAAPSPSPSTRRWARTTTPRSTASATVRPRSRCARRPRRSAREVSPISPEATPIRPTVVPSLRRAPALPLAPEERPRAARAPRSS
jgi:serine/threonine protein kinase